MMLCYTLTAYNGTGGYNLDSGSFKVEYQKDLNALIHMLERTKETVSGHLGLVLTGTFNKDIVLPTKYRVVIN